MRFFALVLTGLLVLASPVAAQQIDVRSGEHADFSRLVFMFPPGTDWSTERVEGGYKLTAPPRTRFNLANVFRLIPKTRIQAISADIDARSVFIETAPDVHLEVFQLPIGAVVVDIADGAEPEPFEPGTPKPQITAPDHSYRPAPKLGYLDLYWSDKPTQMRPEAQPAPPPAPKPAPQPGEATENVAFPDGRISAAEIALIDELGRAASQGLITMQMPKHPVADPHQTDGHEAGGHDMPTTEPAHDTPTEGHDTEGHPGRDESHLALQAETVIDRDSSAHFAPGRLADSGHSCPRDADFDLQSWLTEEAPSVQIAHARRDLLAEFDKPRLRAVEHLAKVYIALGLGTEAKALFKSFGLEEEANPALTILADVVDGNTPDPYPAFKAFTACDSRVALWALVAQPEPPQRETVNFGAVLRAYSALPPPIRNLIGPKLSDRLIEVGAADVAQTVRSMLARAPAEHRSSLEYMDARIDLSEGRVEDATERLDKVAESHSEIAAEALILSVETKLSEGIAIPTNEVENASALAKQLGGSDMGDKLTRVEILGNASTAKFDPAFEALERWEEPLDETLRRDTQNDLLAMLAKLPDEQMFIETFFRFRPQWSPEELEPGVQIALSERLSKSGFDISSRAVLSPATRRSEPGRLAMARAALAGRDAAAAYSHLVGLQGEEAALLRGEALSLLGQHQNAEAAFAEAGATEARLEAAWRAGNWDQVTDGGSEAQRQFLELFSDTAPPAQDRDAAPLGPLAAAQKLIAQSEAERAAFEKLMQDMK
ncbi:hypothetical protein SAMN05877809_104111 [Rhodobacter sp. JA431]|uniref:hypothetical protein n=1 Tax=Rhodobacter sp. JA431 TaxID=570013 RepID=UPI000BC513D9|nr:hypothetical protein [Rhodobacter sp. JA431]SOC07618.1 hypothetical protein SAMN05877809_104111 [Rhodobacter sp. JA431]